MSTFPLIHQEPESHTGADPNEEGEDDRPELAPHQGVEHRDSHGAAPGEWGGWEVCSGGTCVLLT